MAPDQENKSSTGLMIGLAVIGVVVILGVALIIVGVGTGVGFMVLRGDDAEVPDVEVADWRGDWEEAVPEEVEVEEIEVPEVADTDVGWEPPPPFEAAAHGTDPPTDLPRVVPPQLEEPLPQPETASARPTSTSTSVRPTSTSVRPSSASSTESTITVSPTTTSTAVRPTSEDAAMVQDATCDDLRALELTASMGRLSRVQWACLEARKRTTGERPTDRMKVARVMIADAQARCTVLKADCSDYHRELEYYLTELDRSDADVLYSWLLVRYRADPKTEAACEELIWWADQTLALRQQWPPGDVFVERTSKTYLIRGSATYTRFQIANQTYLDTRKPTDLEHEDQVRGEARDYVLEWLEFNRRAELDATTPWELCMTLARKSEVCGAKR